MIIAFLMLVLLLNVVCGIWNIRDGRPCIAGFNWFACGVVIMVIIREMH